MWCLLFYCLDITQLEYKMSTMTGSIFQTTTLAHVTAFFLTIDCCVYTCHQHLKLLHLIIP